MKPLRNELSQHLEAEFAFHLWRMTNAVDHLHVLIMEEVSHAQHFSQYRQELSKNLD